MVLATGQGHHLLQRGPRNRRQGGINLCQRFREINGKGVNDSLPRLLPGSVGADRKGGDIVFQTAAAADTALVMAGHAGGGVEYGAESISSRGQRILWLPLVHEERLSCLCHAGIHRLGPRFGPRQRSNADRNKRQGGDQVIPDRTEALHGIPSPGRTSGSHETST